METNDRVQRSKTQSILLNQELKGWYFIASSAKGWINEYLTLNSVKNVVGSFVFGNRLLAWDFFECHLVVESVKEALNSVKVHTAIIPGGCTKHIQALDLSWNKPFITIGWKRIFMNLQRPEISKQHREN